MSIAGIEDHAGATRRDRGADPGEVGEQPQPGGARLLGVELDAEDVVALGRAGEAVAVGGAAEQLVRLAAAARRSGRSRRASRDSIPSVRRDSRSQRTGDQPMCGTLRPSASSAATAPVEQAEAARRRRARWSSRRAAAGRGRCRGSARRPSRRSAISSSRPRSRIRSIARGKAPTPGRITPSAARTSAASSADRRRGADVLERLLDRAQVAHPVVEDRDPGAHSLSVPLVEGTPLSSGSIETATRRARAKALKQASIMWWALVP